MKLLLLCVLATFIVHASHPIKRSFPSNGNILLIKKTLSSFLLRRSIVSVQHLSIIEKLYKRSGSQPLTPSVIHNILDNYKLLPYHKAVIPWICFCADQRACAHFFRKYNVNINQSVEDGLTPLHYAAWAGNISIVQWLLSVGANVDIKTNDRTSLCYYTHHSDDITKKRIFHVYPLAKETPLHMAQNTLIAQALLKKSANPHALNSNHETPLMTTIHYAAIRAHTLIHRQCVLEYPSKIITNAAWDEKEHDNVYSLVHELLQHGADPNILEISNHQTSLHYAYKYGFFRLPEILYRYGALDVTDISGQLPNESSPIAHVTKNK